MAKLESLMKEINGLSVLELAQLTKALEEECGVSAMAAMTAAPAAPVAGAAAPKAEEKSEYKVEIVGAGDNKMNVIKALRAARKELTVIDAKKLVDNVPCVVVEKVAKAEADALAEALKAAGAEVKLS